MDPSSYTSGLSVESVSSTQRGTTHHTLGQTYCESVGDERDANLKIPGKIGRAHCAT